TLCCYIQDRPGLDGKQLVTRAVEDFLRNKGKHPDFKTVLEEDAPKFLEYCTSVKNATTFTPTAESQPVPGSGPAHDDECKTASVPTKRESDTPLSTTTKKLKTSEAPPASVCPATAAPITTTAFSAGGTFNQGPRTIPAAAAAVSTPTASPAAADLDAEIAQLHEKQKKIEEAIDGGLPYLGTNDAKHLFPLLVQIGSELVAVRERQTILDDIRQPKRRRIDIGVASAPARTASGASAPASRRAAAATQAHVRAPAAPAPSHAAAALDVAAASAEGAAPGDAGETNHQAATATAGDQEDATDAAAASAEGSSHQGKQQMLLFIGAAGFLFGDNDVDETFDRPIGDHCELLMLLDQINDCSIEFDNMAM
ncbi:unnamed protein product, partial [Ectocarpus sp. 12 AP-2014]